MKVILQKSLFLGHIYHFSKIIRNALVETGYKNIIHYSSIAVAKERNITNKLARRGPNYSSDRS
jgi:hypothetical protein